MREAALKSTIFVGVPRVRGIQLFFFILLSKFVFADHWRPRWLERRAGEGRQDWSADRIAQVRRVFAYFSKV